MAELFRWADSLSVGVQKIDDQHKRWLALANDMHNALREGRGRQEVNGCLDGIVDYMSTHFAFEESEMRRTDYPSYADHKALHDAFALDIKDLQKKAAAKELSVSIDVMSTMKDWLVNHITKIDKQFGNYLNQN